MLLERLVQQVAPGKWEQLNAIDKKFDEIEKTHGFPAKKRYQSLFGSHDTNTLIVEREWESLAKMEAAQMANYADPAFQKLSAELNSIILSNRQEIYWGLS